MLQSGTEEPCLNTFIACRSDYSCATYKSWPPFEPLSKEALSQVWKTILKYCGLAAAATATHEDC
jgi:hypothetical protein